MKQHLSALLIASLAIGMQQVQAQETATSQQHKAVKKVSAKKTAQTGKHASTVTDDKEPDTSASTATEFRCELGNTLTIFQKPGDTQRIALRWNKKIHQMDRVNTSTGANRFENHKIGLVWIDIPAKGILLDSKRGRQLANECKSAR